MSEIKITQLKIRSVNSESPLLTFQGQSVDLSKLCDFLKDLPHSMRCMIGREHPSAVEAENEANGFIDLEGFGNIDGQQVHVTLKGRVAADKDREIVIYQSEQD